MYYNYKPAPFVSIYTIYIMVALIIMFYYALKLATNITASGLKKSVTIRYNEKKRIKGSEIYNNFLQLFKNSCSFLWVV